MKRKCICAQCGCAFEGGPRAWYCVECRDDRKRERSRNRPKYANRPLGSEDVCVRCGETYIVNSGLQKYCPKCAVPAVREIDQKQGKDYYHKNKEHRNPVKNAKRRKPPMRTCVICGKEFEHNHTAKITCSEECRRRDRNNKWNATWGKRKLMKQKEGIVMDIKMTYEATKSLKETARICGISLPKVKKILLTNGYDLGGRSSEIKKMRDENKSVEEIAEALNISPKAVNANLPYTKGEYNRTDATKNAIEIRKMRAKNNRPPE